MLHSRPLPAAFAAILLTVVGCGGTALTGAAQAAGPGSAGRANAIAVSTAPLALPLDHEAHVALVQAFSGTPRLPVVVRFRDLSGNLLAQANGSVGAGVPMLATLARAATSTAAPLLVRAEIVLGPATTALPRSCPLHLTLQTVQGDVDDGPALGCGIDPCLDLQPAPPPRTNVFANCTTQRLTLER